MVGFCLCFYRCEASNNTECSVRLTYGYIHQYPSTARGKTDPEFQHGVPIGNGVIGNGGSDKQQIYHVTHHHPFGGSRPFAGG